MEEVWKDILGFEGLYQVSNLGRVRSTPRKGTKGGILKPTKNNNGYLRICLVKDGKQKLYSVHRLVAMVFIPNEDLSKTDINHIDENKDNNCAVNLEWCDVAYNNKYGSRNKRVGKAHINHPNMSKQVNQYDLNGNFIKTWKSMGEIQRETSFNDTNICQCCKGKYKTSYGYIWKYKNEQE